MAIWSKKLEASAGVPTSSCPVARQAGDRPTPITSVYTPTCTPGQQHQEGTRDKGDQQRIVKGTWHALIQIGMADRNEDDLNQFARTIPE